MGLPMGILDYSLWFKLQNIIYYICTSVSPGSGHVYGGTLEEQAGAFEVQGGAASAFEVQGVWGGAFEVRGGVFEVWGGVFEVWGGVFEVRGGVFEVRGGAFEVQGGAGGAGDAGGAGAFSWEASHEMVEDDLGLESWEASHSTCAPGHMNVKAVKVMEEVVVEELGLMQAARVVSMDDVPSFVILSPFDHCGCMSS
ncbi:hypothetical protein BU15DRAFT_68254 [Melanogaster broomeanus]|nr:hypothetical protein BU15DRAFT_68254 [Melanogaster broomeanus]